MAKYISKLINGEELYYLKDDEARANKADKASTVSTISYDTTNKKLTKTINETTSDVVTAADIIADGGVSQMINNAKSEIKGTATSACDTLGDAETLISAEQTRAQTAESALNSGKADKATTLAGYGIADAYTKSETYTKTEVNGLVDSPHQEYVTVDAYANLPATGSKDTIYRVSNYNGSTSQVDASVYSEYAWNGSQYIFLCVKSQIGEVFDITVYNNNTKYADLASALGTDGANVPESLRKGGMSVKFVQTDDKYVQYRYMSNSVGSADFTNEANWELDVTKKNLSEDFLGLLSEIKDFTIKNYAIAASGKFGATVTYKHGVLSVNEGEVYYLIGQSPTCRAAFVTTGNSPSGADVPVVPGTGIMPMSSTQQYYKFIIPQGCTHLIFNASGDYGTRCYKHYDSLKEGTDEYVDDTPIAGSANLVTSGGVAEYIRKALDTYDVIIEPDNILSNTRVSPSGIIESSSLTNLAKISASAGDIFKFSLEYNKNYNNFCAFWFNGDTMVLREDYVGSATEKTIFKDVEIACPNGADTLYINIQSKNSSSFVLKKETFASIQQKKTIRLLSIGNSYSQDALAYVPFILQNMGIDADIQIGIAMMSSSTLEHHLSNFENETAAYTYYYNSGSAWVNNGSKSIQQILDDKTWDIISLQQSSGGVYTWSTYQPYLNKLINHISDYVDYPVKFCWYAVQARPASSNGGANWSDGVITQHYESICENAEKVMNETVCEFLIPVNTAIQNARSIASLKAMGDYASNSNNTSGLGYLTPNDGVHLQEGIPCQIAAYTFVLKLLDIYGFKEYSINGESTRATSEWASDKNIPGPHGTYIDSTDNNSIIAQQCAIMAVKHPYTVTDMNYIINPT